MRYLLPLLLLFYFSSVFGQDELKLELILLDSFDEKEAKERLFYVLNQKKKADELISQPTLENRLRDLWNREVDDFTSLAGINPRIDTAFLDLVLTLDILAENRDFTSINQFITRFGWCDNWRVNKVDNCGIGRSNFQQFKNHMIYSMVRLVLNDIKISTTPNDRDGDGVIDKEDACPTEKGDANNKGCPKKGSIIHDDDFFTFTQKILLISFLSLLVGGFIGFLVGRRKKEQHPTTDSGDIVKQENGNIKITPKRVTTTPTQTSNVKNLTDQITDLTKQIEKLKRERGNDEKTIDRLTKELNKAEEQLSKPDPVTVVATSISSRQQRSSPSRLTTILYVGKPNPKGIITSVSNTKTEKTYYQIAMENMDSETGEFSLVDDDAMRSAAFNAPDTFLSGNICNRMISGTPDYVPGRHRIKPGVVKLENGKWQIVTPMTISE